MIDWRLFLPSVDSKSALSYYGARCGERDETILDAIEEKKRSQSFLFV